MKAYQLKIQIQDSHPPIWRRVIVPAGLTFSQLSILLNETMGWCGCRLTSFEFYHQRIRIEEEVEEYDMWGWDEYDMLESGETLIDDFLDTEDWFTYIYDFGDYWKHRVTVEKVLMDYDKNYAQIIKYKGDTPYEDCGGISGYYELLRILDNPAHPEFEQMKEWTEHHFTEKFDLENVNEHLKTLYLSNTVSGPMTQNQIYEETMKSLPFKKIDLESEWVSEKDYTDVTLKDILEEHTRQELVEIAKMLHLSGYSNLKKEKLVERLCVDLLDKDVMQKYFRFLSESEIAFLESKVNRIEMDYSYESYDMLLAAGYAVVQSDWSEGRIYIPEEVKEAYSKNCMGDWKKSAVIDKEFLMYLNCAAEVYGICPIGKALELYKRDTGESKNEFDVISFCENVPENKKFFVINEAKIVLKMLRNSEDMKEVSAMQKNFDYYEPTLEEIQILGEKGYFPFDSKLNQLKKFFLKYGEETAKDAEELCKRVQFLFRIGGQIDEIMDMLEECFLGFEEVVEDEKLLDSLLNQLFKVMNTTRTFILRGHSPAEVMPEIAKVIKEREAENNIISFPKKS